jgi:hypothetical protein
MCIFLILLFKKIKTQESKKISINLKLIFFQKNSQNIKNKQVNNGREWFANNGSGR